MRKAQDKKEKMQMRKNNKEKGKKLEDMMAYLDENGNLTDQPADPRKKKIFKQEDILVSVPKLEDLPEPEPRKGVVAFFNDHKGFGFINDLETRERLFVHVNDLLAPIKENDRVTYRPGKGPKGPIAMEVDLVR